MTDFVRTLLARRPYVSEGTLIEVADHPGPGAYWAVYRVGPVT